MTLTAIIGALVALLPPALLQRQDKDSAALKLARSNARLIDHIQSLERELLTERHLTQTRIEEIENLNRDLTVQRSLTQHWREEAERLAKHASALRQRGEAQEQAALAHMQMMQMRAALPPPDGRQALAYAQNRQAQTQLAQSAGQGLQGALQVAFEGFCNCVPSRAQVWAEENSLVSRLNREGEG